MFAKEYFVLEQECIWTGVTIHTRILTQHRYARTNHPLGREGKLRSKASIRPPSPTVGDYDTSAHELKAAGCDLLPIIDKIGFVGNQAGDISGVRLDLSEAATLTRVNTSIVERKSI
jgi:hypothetical protein